MAPVAAPGAPAGVCGGMERRGAFHLIVHAPISARGTKAATVAEYCCDMHACIDSWTQLYTCCCPPAEQSRPQLLLATRLATNALQLHVFCQRLCWWWHIQRS